MDSQLWAMDSQDLFRLMEWNTETDFVVPMLIGHLGDNKDIVGLYRFGDGIRGTYVEGNELELSSVDFGLSEEFWAWSVATGHITSSGASELAASWSPSPGQAPDQLSEDGELAIFQLREQGQGISFERVHTIANEGGPHWVVSGDFNSDGLDDLAYTLRNTDELIVWMNPGDI